jgi:uncharacterized DUF497 family protein
MLEFDWVAANLSHIALHSVTAEEAEEVLLGPAFELDTYEVDDEERIEEVGTTKRGRILKVVTTIRDGMVRVVTAYDASPVLKKVFLEWQSRLYE